MASLAEKRIEQIDEQVEEPAMEQPAARPEELRLLEALLFASSEPLDQAALAKRMPEGVDIKDALAQLQRAVELAPRHVHARTNLGVILGRMGRYREAIAEFERVQALDPTNAEALRSLPQLRALAASASAPPR